MMKMMKGALAGLALMSAPAVAADDVTLQLKWVTQAQFAGYYVALENGFYEEEGLNVTIKPGGPDVAPVQEGLEKASGFLRGKLGQAIKVRGDGSSTGLKALIDGTADVRSQERESERLLFGGYH